MVEREAGENALAKERARRRKKERKKARERERHRYEGHTHGRSTARERDEEGREREREEGGGKRETAERELVVRGGATSRSNSGESEVARAPVARAVTRRRCNVTREKTRCVATRSSFARPFYLRREPRPPGATARGVLPPSLLLAPVVLFFSLPPSFSLPLPLVLRFSVPSLPLSLSCTRV